VCVNVSTRQFGPHLVETVASALGSSGFPARFLTLEVTESILMDDVDAAVAIVKDLKALGVSLAIDDFGTGYSSLAYLKQFHLHELKIDKSFVDGLGRDSNDSAIVAAIIALAHALDLGVVAEGVETQEQLARLRSLGCEVAQGYLFGRPAPPDELDRLLQEEAAASWSAHRLADEADREAQRYRPHRILIVDDSAEIRQLTRFALAAVGFEVHEAADGIAGLEAARRLSPDCVLLDVVMPGMDGMAVCRALRAEPATAACTILMLTANADAADKVRAFSEGADDYVIKPFSPRDLCSRIELAMRRRREGAGTTAPLT
jgi:CheY-like chemotaxis protein